MNKKPELIYRKKSNVFLRKGTYDLPYKHFPIYKDFTFDNKICNTKKLSDLTRIKHPINIIEQKDNVIGHCLGNKCYLFIENNEVKIKEMENHIYTRTFETKYGAMIADNHGEFGGFLYNSIGNDLEIAGYGNYICVFEYNDKVYGITTLTHLLSSSCSLREIKKIDEGFEEIIIFESYDLNFAGYYIDRNYFYFCSDYNNIFSDSDDFKGLYRFNLDNNELELIEENFFGDICINDMIKKDNMIYIYGGYNLIEYDLKEGKIRTYTNLEPEDITEFLYVDDIKLIDLWDNLIIQE